MADRGTDGEFDVGNDVSQSQFAIGRNNRITTYQDTATWREFVRHEQEAQRQQILILFIAVTILFFLGGIAGLLTIRQFDLLYTNIEKIEQRPPYAPYYYPGMPLP